MIGTNMSSSGCVNLKIIQKERRKKKDTASYICTRRRKVYKMRSHDMHEVLGRLHV